jgi:PAS domain-containing protein
MDTLALERKHHLTAARLSAALDEVDIGIVLLDADTRAEFINRAFRDYFSLPDAQADSKPPFIVLMYHGRDTRAYELPEEELNAFIARRTAMMRSGDSKPININLSDGRVLRFGCTALPDGGRMLSYTPVTDLVRRTDDPFQRRLSPLAARRRRSQACPAFAGRRIAGPPISTESN